MEFQSPENSREVICLLIYLLICFNLKPPLLFLVKLCHTGSHPLCPHVRWTSESHKVLSRLSEGWKEKENWYLWFKERRPQQLLLLPKESKIEKGLENNSGGKSRLSLKREKIRPQLKTGYLGIWFIIHVIATNSIK